MRLLSSSLAAALMVGLAVGPASAAPIEDLLWPGRLVVGMLPTTDPAAVVNRIGDLALGSRPVPGMDAIVVDVPPESRLEAGERARAGAGIRFAQPDVRVTTGVVPGDAATAGSLDTSRVTAARTWGAGSPDTVVAVLGTGVSPAQGLPAERILPGRDFVDGDTDASDEDGHGTLVAGIIAGGGDSGVCGGCRVLPVRVQDDPGSGTGVDLSAGIVWAADQGARVIMVAGTADFFSYLMRDAVQYAQKKGALIIDAAGNTGTSQPQHPGTFPGVLTVASVDGAGRKSSNTNVNNGFYIEVAAADNLRVPGAAGADRYLAGSPASAAVVAGAAALAFSARPGATAAQVSDAIVAGAVPSPERHYDPPILDAADLMSRFGAADTVNPVVVSTGLTEGRISAEPITVDPMVTDDHGVARVAVLVDGVVVGERKTPWDQPIRVDAPADWSGSREITVRAYDHAGNVAEKSTTVRFDTVAPTVSIVSPVRGSIVRNPVDVVVTASPDTTRVLASGVAMTRAPGTDTWTATIRVPPGGGGLFSVDAYDEAGNIGSANFEGWADEQAPTATGISPAANTRVRGAVTTTISGVTDDVTGVAFAELWANGKRVGRDTTAPYSLKTAGGAYSGRLDLLWKLTDKAGNVRAYTRTVIADNAGPTVSITKAPKNRARVEGTVAVSVKASDAAGVARVELLVNGKVVAKDATAGYLLKVQVNKQSKTMKVQVRAYDKLGNVKSTTTRTLVPEVGFSRGRCGTG
ncbi:S8 family serine peptidase [Actinoplanes couchii]|uniref:S8 family serine peptidase n=1 Tax=Actinoplanes couchii TaxID=403638 RepID=UPI0019453A15|nr:S8 family serine peptidase [Actinoplanes couchii]MDR6324253.1 hypothetical protein [Actinoplanes couchii]